MALDVAHKGYLTRHDLTQGYQKIYSNSTGETIINIVNNIINRIDYDQRGKIEYSEWVLSTIDKHQILSERYLKKAFSFFGDNNKQTINLQDMLPVLFPTTSSQLEQRRSIQEYLNIDPGAGLNHEFTFESFSDLLNRLLYARVGTFNTAGPRRRSVVDDLLSSLTESDYNNEVDDEY